MHRSHRHARCVTHARHYREYVRVLALVAALGLVPSHLGSGDSVRPRDIESKIAQVEPALPGGVTVDVVGSDTFLRVRTTQHVVEVPGYEDEPYLRLDADGSAWVNENSKTAVLNGDRYGDVDLSNFSSGAAEKWVPLAGSGSLMWHDHRSHWMSPKPPAPIDATGKVQDFVVPVVVDGVRHEISGAIYLREKSSIWWWGLGVLAVVGFVALSAARRRRFVTVAPVAGLVAGAVGVVQWQGLPHGARVTPLLAVFGLAAAVIGAAGLVVSARRRDTLGALVAASLNAGAGAMLVAVGWMTADHVRAAYVPGMSPAWIVRALVPVMLAAGIVASFDGISRVVRGDVD